MQQLPMNTELSSVSPDEEFPATVLCSTHRLARNLRLAHGRAQISEGRTQWQPLAALTIEQWLDGVLDEAMLSGEVAAATAPRWVLDPLQERILWERAIGYSLTGDVMASLFDCTGMAQAAMEANHLSLAWEMAIPGEPASSDNSEETRQFLLWREAFRKSCAKAGCVEATRHLDWQIEQIARGVGRLPPKLQIVGFDRISPQVQRLLDVLAMRGVKLGHRNLGCAVPANTVQVMVSDQDAECRAVAAWAQRKLQQNPLLRLVIVVPELAKLREKLANALDDALHPVTITPAHAEMARCYDFSLGISLSAYPLVATALALLRLVAGRRQVVQEEFGALLQQPYWSAGLHEADQRAWFDALMRAALPRILSLDRIERFAEKAMKRGLGISRLATDLHALIAVSGRQPARHLPSAWAVAFRAILEAAGWPGERTLSSHEFQSRLTFGDTLMNLGQLDQVLGAVDLTEGLCHLSQMCNEKIFQPQMEGNPAIQVMGMLEAISAPHDALWVMGMNDHVWPPPARLNPLLPAHEQRRVAAPNSCAQVQAEFAQTIHARLLHSAPEVIFSWAKTESDRELRPSVLIAGLPYAEGEVPMAASLAERLMADSPAPLQMENDSLAPRAEEGERIPGGSGLLRAQAICPAWAYYRFRLGARKLETPRDELDAAGRGSLLHLALQHFWQGRGSHDLLAMSGEQCAGAVSAAVDLALEAFNAQQEESLKPSFMVLERERLMRLVNGWLEVEIKRPASFRVTDCEHKVRLEIEGIVVNLIIDRIDTLDDGRLVILDYKTGVAVDYRNWARVRITEPQLPIYSSLVLSGKSIAAVCFARVRLDDNGFAGISAEAETLPGVAGLNEKKGRDLFPEESFPNWQDVLEHWRSSIQSIAQEIRAGEAAVYFNNEKDLAYCEVMPLLRLPERKLQMERAVSGHPFKARTV